MYNANKIITGLVIFAILLAFPIWNNVASGKSSYVPEPKIVTDEKQCVEPKQYMKDTHMQLLEEWRQSVVRDGTRMYVASDGKKYDISLTNTCMKCHSNKKEFCDQCHNYAGVSPNCWDCHNAPEEEAGNGTK